MILTIDVGNTNIMFGGFIGDELSFVARVATDDKKTEDEYASLMLGILDAHKVKKTSVKGAIISSVVPQLNSVLKKAVKFIYGVEPLLVGPGIKTGIGIQCDNPASVGSDLICSCVATHFLYESPALIVDMGTATKMTVVNEKGSFIGVSIIPGLKTGLRALAEGTAQLPQVSLEAPAHVIGKNTVDCMKSGVIFGHASMIDGMIDRICDEFGAVLPVYATGGLASVVIPHCKHEIKTDEYLVLKGLNLIFKKNS